MLPVAAVVAALVATVTLDDVPARPVPVDTTPRPPVPVGTFLPVVDGVIEPGWDTVPVAPPLVPWELGRSAPDAPARVTLTPDALVVAAPALGRRWAQTWVLDPEGLGQAWWEVRWDADEVVASRCGFLDLTFEAPAMVPSRALPCVPDDRARVVRSPTGAEVVFPRDRLTSSARLLWVVESPDAHHGTWAPGGKATALPELGRPLVLDAVPARLSLVPDPDRDVLRVAVTGRRALPAGAWSWRILGEDDVLASGTFAVATAGDAVTVDVPWLHRAGHDLEVRGPDTSLGVPSTWVSGLGDPVPEVWVRSPVTLGRVVLGFSTPVALPDRRLVLSVGRRELGAVEVDLPAGTGTITVDGLVARGAVTVVMDGLLPDGRVWVTR